MDRLNHVKIVTPDPAAVDRFLREVVDIPGGWSLGAAPSGREVPPSEARTPEGGLTWDSVIKFRGSDEDRGGFIAGNERSRQFQILSGERAHIWCVAIGTRHLERAHERCVARGIPCTEMELVPWGEKQGVRAFFAEVGGIVFEVMRVEAEA